MDIKTEEHVHEDRQEGHHYTYNKGHVRKQRGERERERLRGTEKGLTGRTRVESVLEVCEGT